MHPESIIYEQPLNEKCRTLLRLASLFEQLDFHIPHENVWHTRAALNSLLDIISVLSRSDIKSELLKEMERYRIALNRISDNPDVDTDRLKHTLQSIQESQQTLQNIQGQLGQALRKNEFLNSIQQRRAIPGGGSFDLPQLHVWLEQAHSERLLQLDDWRNEINPVNEAVDLLLNLIRNSTVFSPQTAVNGFYQQNLPGQQIVQMLRVAVAKNANIYAETSGGRHRFSIRFMQTGDWEHPIQITHDVEFELNICTI
jgi:cell division protein ZapD